VQASFEASDYFGNAELDRGKWQALLQRMEEEEWKKRGGRFAPFSMWAAGRELFSRSSEARDPIASAKGSRLIPAELSNLASEIPRYRSTPAVVDDEVSHVAVVDPIEGSELHAELGAGLDDLEDSLDDPVLTMLGEHAALGRA